jgi:hypothetical protein
MMMENCGITPVYDINDGNKNNNYGWADGGGVWIIFLFFLMAWGGNGWGGFGNGGANGALTRADLCQDMNFQSVENGVRGIQQGLCDGFYAQNTTMLQGFAGVDSALCNGFNNVNNNITQARFDSQQCCCETNRNIDAVRYENARNTCDIVNAIREDGALTRAQMTANEMQNLRDQLNTANLQLSQQAQSANLINQLRPCPIPAYLSCSPYTSYDPFGYNGYNGFGRSGCGCGCGC